MLVVNAFGISLLTMSAVNLIEPELEELDNLSGHSSEAPCDCPAHVHDRDTPLLIDKVPGTDMMT